MLPFFLRCSTSLLSSEKLDSVTQDNSISYETKFMHDHQVRHLKRRCAKLEQKLQQKEEEIQSMEDQYQLQFPLLMHETMRSLRSLENQQSEPTPSDWVRDTMTCWHDMMFICCSNGSYVATFAFGNKWHGARETRCWCSHSWIRATGGFVLDPILGCGAAKTSQM